MRKLLLVPTLLGGLLLGMPAAHAHCDSVDGPVASAALDALGSGNVNLVLPYVAEAAEAEIMAAFAESTEVRAAGGAAAKLADRFFVETAVRLHRLGEGAAYTGLKPAGTDFGPAIPAAEKALEAGQTAMLEDLLVDEVRHAIRERFAHADAHRPTLKEPKAHQEVAAARARVGAELGFVAFVEGIHLAATTGGNHEE